MNEIGHIKEAEPPEPEPEPEPEPARPILASQLLELEEKQRTRFAGDGRSENLKTGCGNIDELLGGGGVERGIVVGITAEGGEGRLISLNLLATVLLSHLPHLPNSVINEPGTKAVVIDTTGSFPLSLLARILKSRIVEARAASTTPPVQTANCAVSGQEGARQRNEEGVDAEVQRCLEMVALSRVFDIEGLWEVLREVGRGSSKRLDGQEKIPADEAGVGEVDPRQQRESSNGSPQKSAEIEDSEDEITPLDDRPSPKPTRDMGRGGGAWSEEEDVTEIIIVDNMTHIINEIFARKEKGNAHTLLSLLSQSFHTLAGARNILTIIHNTTVLTKSTYPLPNPQRQPQSHQPTSVFPSNPIKPALGQIFTQFSSLHLFLSSLPKYKGDAEALYGQDGEAGVEKINFCTVVEVLKDETPNLSFNREEAESDKREFGWREGRWCAVEVSGDGLRLIGSFEKRGNMRGIDMERIQGREYGVVESRVGLGVGNVAKIWGFGGRRV